MRKSAIVACLLLLALAMGLAGVCTEGAGCPPGDEVCDDHDAHCLCPCHGLTVAPRPPAAAGLRLFALVPLPLPAALSGIDLPGTLRPPIA